MHAKYVMVSTYTIGQDLDVKSSDTESGDRLLEEYITDLIGLTALEKTCSIVKKIAEEQAQQLGWGVLSTKRLSFFISHKNPPGVVWG
jgi:hypothetical protein